ncbi:hypothetical protein EG68_08175 [Paragonimus skrjabini miyazakii]|uniref:Uncharacterized protein n=1 Tax=Paragonimus skrjabini miyazakii TaxID=59628 RepID=A0A8S9YST6_9TREM|nr:hypothetical protein EG68_08175 [Paragonimus skrjabini miyazakii]
MNILPYNVAAMHTHSVGALKTFLPQRGGRQNTTCQFDDRFAGSVPFAHGSKKARITIAWNDYPVDIIEENTRCDEHDDGDFI